MSDPVTRAPVSRPTRGQVLPDWIPALLDASESDAALLVLDPDGFVRAGNAAVARILGHEPERLVGRHIAGLHPPYEIAAGIPAGLLAAAETQGRVVGEGVQVRADGSHFVAGVTVTALRDRGGDLVGFAHALREAAGSATSEVAPADAGVLLEDELRQRLLLQTRLERIADTAPGVLHELRLAPDGTASFPYVSPAFFDVIGLRPELVREDASVLIACIHPDDAEAVEQATIQSAETLSILRGECRIRHPWKGERWIEAAAAPTREDDGSVVWHGFLRDVTNRKRMELDLMTHRRQLEEAQRVGRVGSFEYDLLTGAVEWSAEHRRIFDLDPADPVPVALEDFLALLHPFDRDIVRLADDEGRCTGEPFEVDYRIVKRDGSTAWIHAHGAFELDADGRPVRQRGTVQDVTVRRTLEEQLRQSQKLEAIGLLAGGVAHDFNNLLTVISGHTEVLQAVIPPGRAHSSLESIRQAADQAASLTRRLLAFSRNQALDVRTIDLDEVVLGLDGMLGTIIGADVRLELLPGGAGAVRADEGQIEQVLLNLVVNACDAMPRGGRLAVSTATVDVPAGASAVDAEVPAGRYVELTVSDTGHGMGPGVLERAFEPFFTTKEPGKGTGLGLAMVLGTVRQSGGYLSVETAPGSGTCIRILLPPAPTDDVAAPPPASGGEPAATSGTVLLVEDDGAVRELAAGALTRLGYSVLEAADGRQALDLAARTPGPIDLVLTDVVMPHLGGIELAGELRSRRPEIRIVLMSGYASGIDRVDVDRVGDGFVAKPFSTDTLAETLRLALAR